VQPHFHSEQGLDNAVVQVASHTRTFDGACFATQSAQEIDVVNGGTYLLPCTIQEAQCATAAAAELAVQQEEPTGSLIAQREVQHDSPGERERLYKGARNFAVRP
jgi:hypothetical protein